MQELGVDEWELRHKSGGKMVDGRRGAGQMDVVDVGGQKSAMMAKISLSASLSFSRSNWARVLGCRCFVASSALEEALTWRSMSTAGTGFSEYDPQIPMPPLE